MIGKDIKKERKEKSWYLLSITESIRKGEGRKEEEKEARHQKRSSDVEDMTACCEEAATPRNCLLLPLPVQRLT